MGSEDYNGPIRGAEHAEPPPPSDAPPDFQITPEQPPSEPEPERKAKPIRAPQLQKQLEDFFGGIGLLVATTGDHHCAEVIFTQAKPLAEAWTELAKKNDRIRHIITLMLEGSAWGQVIVVTAATVIPIAAHHGIYPSSLPMPFTFGIGNPPPPSDEVRDAADQDKPES